VPKRVSSNRPVSQMHSFPSGKKNKYDTLDNFPGEVLTDIHVLADQFLIAFPNINSALMSHASSFFFACGTA